MSKEISEDYVGWVTWIIPSCCISETLLLPGSQTLRIYEYCYVHLTPTIDWIYWGWQYIEFWSGEQLLRFISISELQKSSSSSPLLTGTIDTSCRGKTNAHSLDELMPAVMAGNAPMKRKAVRKTRNLFWPEVFQ